MEKRLSQVNRHLTKTEAQKYRTMDALEITSHGFRRARTRSLIQLGSLVVKAGLVETFQITLGDDLQRDPDTKEPIAALFKGFLILNEIANSEETHMPLWIAQGLTALAKDKEKKN